jgi:hypothetical protein
MTVRGLCRFLGVLLALLGVVGPLAPRLFGLHLTPLNNALQLASAAAALYFASTGPLDTARRFALGLGLGYLALGLLGFVALAPLAALLGGPDIRAHELAPDNAAHLVLGGGFVLASAARARPAPRRTGPSVVGRI